MAGLAGPSAAQSGFGRAPGTERVIVRAPAATVRQLARRYRVPVVRHLSVGGVLELTATQANELRAYAGSLVAPDIVVEAAMTTSATAVGADQAWHGVGPIDGVTGRGVGIAILDSGISPHPDFADRVIVNLDFVDPEGDGSDPFGHGTHAAGVAAGRPADGLYPGVAPGAHLLNLLVLDAEGYGRASAIIAAVDWVIANRERYAIRVVNMSLGGAVTRHYTDDPLALAVERAVDAGLVVVCSAGNHGKLEDGTTVLGGITTPGSTPGALTVGAVNTFGTVARSDDAIATFSSRGPTAIDYVLKPDVSAPGNRIVSAQAAGASIPVSYPELQVAGGYLELSGTSMAAAVVSGAVALMLEANPALTPAQVKAALQLTASPVNGAGLVDAGAGSINVAAAVQTAVHGPSPEAPATTVVIVIGDEPQTASNLVFTAVPAALVKPRWGGIRGPHDLAAAVRANNLIVSPRPVTAGAQPVAARRGFAGPASRHTGFASRAGALARGYSGHSIVWGDNGNVWSGSIVWGDNADTQSGTIVWGDNANVWGGSIVWGDNANVWGGSIVWGDNANVWGGSIVWGDNANVWGGSIVWGDNANVWSGSIVWGDNANVWGGSIVWGDKSDRSLMSGTLIWGDVELFGG